MSERKKYNPRLCKTGELIMNYRKALGSSYRSRDKFINNRSIELFGGDDWISSRHLASIEEGKALPSIEMLILLSTALEIPPEQLFREIVDILTK